MTARRREPLTWFEWALFGVTVAVVVVMLWQWSSCDGTFVRTLFWFRCLP